MPKLSEWSLRDGGLPGQSVDNGAGHLFQHGLDLVLDPGQNGPIAQQQDRPSRFLQETSCFLEFSLWKRSSLDRRLRWGDRGLQFFKFFLPDYRLLGVFGEVDQHGSRFDRSWRCGRPVPVCS